MKRFLLLALTAGLLSPIAANAESYWLIVLFNEETSQKIEMESLEQCQQQGEAWKNSGIYKKAIISRSLKYVCLKGK